MSPMLLALALNAVPAAEPPPRVLVLELKAVGVDAATVRTLNGLIIAEVNRYRPRIEILSSVELRQVVELEGERQMMSDCDEDTSCLAELADALGAANVIYGDIGKLGTTYVINIGLLDARSVKSLGFRSVNLTALERAREDVRPELDALLAPLIGKAGPVEEMPPPLEPAPAAATSSGPWLGLGALGLGAVGVVAGAVPLVGWAISGGELQRLSAEGGALDDAKRVGLEHEAAATNFETWGWPVMAAGTVLLATGGVLLLLGGGE